MGLAGKASALAGKGGMPRHDDGLHHRRQHHQPVAARSWGTGPASGGQSVSTTGGSVGLPSATRSEPSTPDASVSATPASESTLFRLHHHDIDDDDAGSQQGGGKKKKRAARTVGTDKGGRGLRQFSMKVCEKVESKGRTTYNEVADELVAEFADPSSSFASQDQQLYDEKNIRRRVYDALNVLMAMDIISKDKKEIRWKGLPRTSLSDIEELTAERSCLRNRIDKKAAFFRELEEQYVGLQNLIQRNEQLSDSCNAPDGGVDLPFILVQTRPHATVEVEISEDMQLVHFDFNSTPFELHDDAYVLKAMNLSQLSGAEGEQDFVANGGNNPGKDTASQNLMSNPPRPSPMGKPSASHPVPGILKGRLKQ